ncbi:hypothetical protein CEY15_04225 [Dietzia natronolimnaea]|uniref:Uncharacterized protein n=1 Tax=Dietzia natronolimnaea TaxID=161920 RepID=A0A2A2WSP1_9ACTN|nr:hypothetical protein CEY15_04225 [Dietzia natronolimnaea]
MRGLFGPFRQRTRPSSGHSERAGRRRRTSRRGGAGAGRGGAGAGRGGAGAGRVGAGAGRVRAGPSRPGAPLSAPRWRSRRVADRHAPARPSPS